MVSGKYEANNKSLSFDVIQLYHKSGKKMSSILPIKFPLKIFHEIFKTLSVLKVRCFSR